MPTAHELDDLNNVDIESKLREAKEELFNLRFQAATGQLESHGRLRAVKRDIARIYTVIRERELGIRATPVVDEAPAKAAKRRSEPVEDKATKKSEAVEAPEADTEIVEEAK